MFRACLIGAKLDYTTQIDGKWRLVWEITSQGTRGRNLSKADLSEANLFNTDLTNANLHGANLRDAYLPSANLSSADLSDADLRNANLNNTNLDGAIYNKNTIWPTSFDPKKAGAILVGNGR